MNAPHRTSGTQGLIQLLIGAGLFTGLALQLWHQQPARPVRTVPEQPAEFRPDPALTRMTSTRIVELVRTLKLVTVEVHATATAELRSRNWRGEGVARVSAPTRYLYGVDLSDFRERDIQVNPELGSIILQVPPPTRLTTEVYTNSLQESVRVSGLRLRSRVGEHLLGQARLAVHAEAVRAELPADQAGAMLVHSKDSIQALVEKLVNDDRRIEVQFRQQADDRLTAALP